MPTPKRICLTCKHVFISRTKLNDEVYDSMQLMRNAGIESDNQGKHRDDLKEKRLYINNQLHI